MTDSWLVNLLFTPSVAHSVLLVALTIAIGLYLTRIKIGGVGLGVTWVLFVGIIASHFGLVLDDTTSHFIKEFGLILFIYSIGIQVGPGFFHSFKKGGITLNMLAAGLILLGTFTAYAIHLVTGQDLFAMVGVLYGAVTNTPGLGAAQQTFSDMHDGASNALFAQGYAVAYPLGVVGIILCIVLVKVVFRISLSKEEEELKNKNGNNVGALKAITLEITNPAVDGRTIEELTKLSGREVVVTRLMHRGTEDIELVKAQTRLQLGDRVYLVVSPNDVDALTVFLGQQVDMNQQVWDTNTHNDLVSEKLVVTNAKLNGKRLGDLQLRQTFHVTITRIRRAGIDLLANPNLFLQMGDRVTVVGSSNNVKRMKDLIGDRVRSLDEPQLLATFLGISLGVLLGSLPIAFPGMPVPVKLGLAGGPLIVSILVSKFGPKYKLVTYTTASANLLMRQIGICLFMAAVGLGAGVGFVDTVLNGGYMWVFYGFLITFIPCFVLGIIARVVCHRNYFTIAGMISGAMTDPPALAYSNSISGNDQASVAYSTVYPLSMFLRVIMAQIMVLFG